MSVRCLNEQRDGVTFSTAFLLKTRLFEIVLHYDRDQISWIKMFGMQFSYATTIYPHMLTWYLSEIDCAILDKERTKKNLFQ